MSKLRLDLESIQVESFTATPTGAKPAGTVHGQGATEIGSSCQQTFCNQTCAGDASCQQTFCAQTCDLCGGGTGADQMCTADCTGIGVECYTNDPVYYACTGQDPCTGARACTYNTCAGYC
jgi:hypothetical protein